MNTTLLSAAANQARGLAMDAVHKCSLRPPRPAARLRGNRRRPLRPRAALQSRRAAWLNRDRFVLSAGHGSMFLYAWLHLTRLRAVDRGGEEFPRSCTRTTPGPPGVSRDARRRGHHRPARPGRRQCRRLWPFRSKMAAAKFNTAEHTIFDYHVVASRATAACRKAWRMEAVAFAGHFKLDNLILIYDSNDVTLDAMANETQSENTGASVSRPSSGTCRPSTATTWPLPEGLQQGEERDKRQAAAHHRPHAHRQGHPRSAPAPRRRTAKAARNSSTPRAQGARPARRRAFLRQRRGDARISPSTRSDASEGLRPRGRSTYEAWREANPDTGRS